jgi:quinol monooxygenase YgiN
MGLLIAVGDMYGISGRRDELATRLAQFESWAAGEPGCRRYTFAATIADPSRFMLVSVWDSQAALDAHYASPEFADFQSRLRGLLVRTSELAIYAADDAVRPLDSSPMDPRDAD